MWRKAFAVLAVLWMAAGAVEAGEKGRVAILAPLTGPNDDYGELQLRGYQLAAVDLARRDMPVETRFFDIGQAPSPLDAKFREDVLSWKPDLIIGPYSSERAGDVITAFAALGAPVILPSPTLDALTQSAPGTVYRIAAPASLLSESAGGFLQQYLQVQARTTPVWILYENTGFGRASRDALTAELRRRRIEPVSTAVLTAEVREQLEGRDWNAQPVVIAITRSLTECQRLAAMVQQRGTLLGYAAGFLSPEFRQYALREKLSLYVLNPWQDDAATESAARFVAQFQNRYRTAFSPSTPQYHEAQAFSALTVAGEALQMARGGRALSDVLQGTVFETPMGAVDFTSFDGFDRQARLVPVVQHVSAGSSRTVYPPERAAAVLRPERRKDPGGFLGALIENQFIALFAILGTGLLLGRLTLGGVSLGSSGVLFTALIFGHYHFTVPGGIGTLGLVLFLFAVGITAGPSFFAAFAKQGVIFAKLSILIVVSAAALTVALAKVFQVPEDLAAGLLAGALTSTPALAAATDVLKEAGGHVSVGYGIAYPFGVIGVVLFVQLMPRLLRKNLDALAAELEPAQQKNKIVVAHVEVSNPLLFGKRIEDCEFISQARCRISRKLEGDQLVPVRYDTAFEKGQVLRVVAQEDAMPAVIEFLGRKTEMTLRAQQSDFDVAEMVLTDKQMAGQSLGELQLLRRFGVTVTRISRNEVAFVPNRESRVQLFDQLKVVGDPEGLKQFAQECGHRPKALQETDLFSLSVGLLAGVILGLMPVSIAGLPPFSLGLSGGVLLMALLLGHFGQIGGIAARMPVSARSLLMELGLVFFLAHAGVQAGGAFIEVLREYGAQLFLIGAVLTLVPMLLGYIAGTTVLRLNLLQALGAICGGMTSTPALGAIKSKTDSNIPVISYAAAYPVALIFMLIVTPVVIMVLKWLL